MENKIYYSTAEAVKELGVGFTAHALRKARGLGLLKASNPFGRYKYTIQDIEEARQNLKSYRKITDQKTAPKSNETPRFRLRKLGVK